VIKTVTSISENTVMCGIMKNLNILTLIFLLA